jgi:LCP family protein required for cell wall assembly
MLIHLDPHAAATTVLSIPRDLKIDIPGHGPDKINAAYSLGGPAKVLATVKELLGPNVPINHVINVQFHGFQKLVNYVDGVYVDVDQFYYHSNAGVPSTRQYSEIDIKPGYQKLVGSQALAYVRYRHTDSDFVRAGRQQDFLRQVKDQIATSKLLNQHLTILSVVSKDVQFDDTFTKTYTLLNLIRLGAFSTGKPVQQVPFPAGPDESSNGAQYVTVDAAAIPGIVQKFLHPVRLGQPRAATAHATAPAHQPARAPSSPDPGLMPAKAQLENASAPGIAHGQVTFPFYLPAVIASGTSLASYQPPLPNPYTYVIYDRNVDRRHPRGHPHQAYRFSFLVNRAQGAYYGVQGTNWMSPPLVANPTQTVIKGGRRLEYFTSGGKLRFVAWKTKHGVYWVSNTLDYELSNQQMVGIARSLTLY